MSANVTTTTTPATTSIVHAVYGVEIVNACKHALTFGNPENPKDDAGIVMVPPCGIVMNAELKQEPAGKKGGAEIGKMSIWQDPASTAALEAIEKEHPDAIIVGSMIAAQAYPGRVFAMVPLPGFEREASDKKRMNPRKFTVY